MGGGWGSSTHSLMWREGRQGEGQEAGEMGLAGAAGRLAQIQLARGEDGAVLTIGDAACGRVGDAASVVYLTGMGALDLCAAAMISRRSTA